MMWRKRHERQNTIYLCCLVRLSLELDSWCCCCCCLVDIISFSVFISHIHRLPMPILVLLAHDYFFFISILISMAIFWNKKNKKVEYIHCNQTKAIEMKIAQAVEIENKKQKKN